MVMIVMIVTPNEPTVFDECVEIFVKKCIAENAVSELMTAITLGIEQFEIVKTEEGGQLKACLKQGEQNENSESI